MLRQLTLSRPPVPVYPAPPRHLQRPASPTPASGLLNDRAPARVAPLRLPDPMPTWRSETSVYRVLGSEMHVRRNGVQQRSLDGDFAVKQECDIILFRLSTSRLKFR